MSLQPNSGDIPVCRFRPLQANSGDIPVAASSRFKEHPFGSPPLKWSDSTAFLFAKYILLRKIPGYVNISADFLGKRYEINRILPILTAENLKCFWGPDKYRKKTEKNVEPHSVLRCFQHHTFSICQKNVYVKANKKPTFKQRLFIHIAKRKPAKEKFLILLFYISFSSYCTTAKKNLKFDCADDGGGVNF